MRPNVAVVVSLAVLCLQACAARTAVTPARSTVTITETVREPLQPLGPMGPGVPPSQQFRETTRTQTAESTGAGLSASGEKIVTEFDGSAPEVALDGKGGAQAKGGGFSLDATVTGWLGFSPLFIMGGLCLLGAAVLAYLRLARAAMFAGAAGGGMLLIALYPSVLLIAAVAAVGVVVLWWSDQRGLWSTEAARATIAGVEGLPEDLRRKVKRAIGQHADERDRTTIRTLKRRDGYSGES